MSTSFEKKLTELFQSLRDDKLVEARLDLNKFYQERIETLRTRLWNTLTWLAAAQGAALLLIIKQGGLRTAPGPDLVMEEPILIIFLALLGAMLARYMCNIVDDGIDHIRSNQKNSNFVLGLEPKAGNQPVFNVMRTLAVSAFRIELLLALVGFLGIIDWLIFDIPHLRISIATHTPS